MKTADGTLMGKNIIPLELESYSKTISTYTCQMLNLGECLMSGIALGLGLEETYFKRLLPSFWCMRFYRRN
jgi:isopenicillin N synthase-like dioxygenase